MVKNSVIIASTVVVSAAILVAGLFLNKPAQVVIQNPLGAVSGPAHQNPEQFYNDTFFSRMDFGGLNTPAVTNATTGIAFTATQICDYGIINVSVGLEASTTLPTGAALGARCLPTVGDTRTVVIANVSTTGQFWIAGSTSSTLLVRVAAGATSTAAAVMKGESVILRFHRTNNAEVKVTGLLY